MSTIDQQPTVPGASTQEEEHNHPDRPRPNSNVANAADSNLNPTIKPSRRRDKPQLSCNPCRTRKSRCDRNQPCYNCSTRGLTCTYAPGNSKSSSGLSTGQSATPGTLGVQDRLVQLERLVMSLIPTAAANNATETRWSNQARGEDPSSVPLMDTNYTTPGGTTPLDTISDSGSIRVTGASDLHYVVGEHWSAILDNIADLKDHFDREEQRKLTENPYSSQDMDGGLNPRPPSPPGHALLLYPIHRSSRAEMLASLPPKDAVDRYLSYYFNHLDHASCECSSLFHKTTSNPISKSSCRSWPNIS